MDLQHQRIIDLCEQFNLVRHGQRLRGVIDTRRDTADELY